MAFDKKLAMRNAEKYLSQGKLRAAIGEYRRVTSHDPADVVTLNMLGDLYVKDNDKDSALKCFRNVADHYSGQGFAAKAIAVYNKMSRIAPLTPDMSAQLAELYRQKGSVVEAKSHYVTLAEDYEKNGRKVEALAIWKQIASLDAKNTDVLEHIGETYLGEGDAAEAVAAFVEVGERHKRAGRADEAENAFRRAIAADRFSAVALRAMVGFKNEQGCGAEAREMVAGIYSEKPGDPEIGKILFECELAHGSADEAEATLNQIVAAEPFSYPLLLELSTHYFENEEDQAAIRTLVAASEHLFSDSRVDELAYHVERLRERVPMNLDLLRLDVSVASWQKDEKRYTELLKLLASAAREAEAVEDERSALMQLTMLCPNEVYLAQRLAEINELHGFEDSNTFSNSFDARFFGMPAETSNGSQPAAETAQASFGFETNGSATEPAATQIPTEAQTNGASYTNGELTGEALDRLPREIDSIKFYLDSGYNDLALSAAEDLRKEFGPRPEVEELLETIKRSGLAGVKAPAGSAVEDSPTAESSESSFLGSEMDDLFTDLGLDPIDQDSSADFETHYNTAIAYQEMGLAEDAIREFQDAAGLVGPNDGTRRFYSCANMLGHCFMSIGKPHLARTWYERALEVKGLSPEEQQGLWYEYAHSCESDGDTRTAAAFFEKVYIENVGFRDVSQRLERMSVAA
ncbi:MAG: tetratricopeptide repeat protein [Acidobacteria bacterium]|nr:tetratricopeptide repeat protein [Acidobacteriota bacterium]